jgi:thiamine biosynthesis lipoprotein
MRQRNLLGLIIVSALVSGLSACASEDASSSSESDLVAYKGTDFVFDSVVIYQYLAPEGNDITSEISDFLVKIDELCDPYHASEKYVNVYDLNQDHQLYTVDSDLYDILKMAAELKEQTEGYYDPMIGELSTLWKETLFGGIEPVEGYEPTQEAIDAATTEAAGYLADLADSHLTFDEENGKVMRMGEGKIDLGGLVKGYATEWIETKLKAITPYYYVNAGTSSLGLGLSNVNGAGWKVKIDSSYLDPELETDPYRYSVTNADASTSAIYEQYKVVNGVVYSHVINTQTGLPCTDYSMAFLIGDDAAQLDAFSTAMMIAGEDKAKEWEQEYGISCALFVDKTKTYDGETIHYAEESYEGDGLVRV